MGELAKAATNMANRAKEAAMRLLPTSRWRALIIKAVTVSSRPHLQLRQAALCLDCEECFELGTAACPVRRGRCLCAS